MRKFVLCLFVAASSALSARASIICVAPTSTVAGSIQVTSPISFSITTTGTAVVFDLSGWVTSDGSQTELALSPNLAYSLNGTAGSQAGKLGDNLASTFGSVGPNDGYFYAPGGIPVTAGNTLTLLAGTYTIAAGSSFNPQATQTFIGNMFVIDNSGVRLSAITTANAVPEPSTWAMTGLGVVGLGLTLRQRRRTARLA